MNVIDCSFERVKRFENDETIVIPSRATIGSAGYDFCAAEDTVIFPYNEIISNWDNKIITDLRHLYPDFETAIAAFRTPKSLDETAALTKQYNCKPTLVPTGIKCRLPEGFYLELAARSSLPLKHWLILANSIGIIDADYYSNPQNDGEIGFQLINLSPFPIVIKKGEKFGQGIIKHFMVSSNEVETFTDRQGGFGSTTNN